MSFLRKIINFYYCRKGERGGLFLDLPYRVAMSQISGFNSHDKRLDGLEKNADLINNLSLSSGINNRSDLTGVNHSFQDKVVCNYLQKKGLYGTGGYGNHRMKIAKNLGLTHAWTFLEPSKFIFSSKIEAHFFVSELMRMNDKVIDRSKFRIIVTNIAITDEILEELCRTKLIDKGKLTYEQKIAFILQNNPLLKYYIVIDKSKKNLKSEVKTLSEFKKDAGIFGILYKL